MFEHLYGITQSQRLASGGLIRVLIRVLIIQYCVLLYNVVNTDHV